MQKIAQKSFVYPVCIYCRLDKQMKFSFYMQTLRNPTGPSYISTNSLGASVTFRPIFLRNGASQSNSDGKHSPLQAWDSCFCCWCVSRSFVRIGEDWNVRNLVLWLFMATWRPYIDSSVGDWQFAHFGMVHRQHQVICPARGWELNSPTRI